MTGWTYQSSVFGNQWTGNDIWEIGYDPQHWEQDADPKTLSTLIRGGNYDYVTNTVHWDNISSQTLPDSLYLSSKPAFFGSYTWPWVDPTGSTKLYILPAKARYDAGTPFLLPVTNPPPPAATGSVSINDLNIVEGNSGTQLATFTVLRSGGTDPFNVSYATADGTATAADGDYIPTSGTLQFATGVNAQTFTVTINGDTKVEPTETFFVNLSGATNSATISKSQGTGTIINDTGPDELTLRVSEDAWLGDAQFIVTVNGHQLGDVQTVTASHAAGQSQTITLLDFSDTDISQVAVEFINDAWGGTPDTDRNLYVDQLTIN